MIRAAWKVVIISDEAISYKLSLSVSSPLFLSLSSCTISIDCITPFFLFIFILAWALLPLIQTEAMCEIKVGLWSVSDLEHSIRHFISQIHHLNSPRCSLISDQLRTSFQLAHYSLLKIDENFSEYSLNTKQRHKVLAHHIQCLTLNSQHLTAKHLAFNWNLQLWIGFHKTASRYFSW